MDNESPRAEVGDVLLNKDTYPEPYAADYANKVRRHTAYPKFEPPVIFGPGIQITPKVNDAEFLQNLKKYSDGNLRCFVVPQGVVYKMPEYVELTISRERMDVIITHLQSLLDNTNAEEFDLTVSKEKFAVRPILPQMEIVLQKEK